MHRRRAAWPARTGPLAERRKPRRGTAAALALCLVAIGTLHLTPPPVAARERRLTAREVRTIHPSDFGLESPTGISYDPVAEALLIAGSAPGGRTVLELTPGEERLGTSKLPAGDPATIAFDDDRGAITTLNEDELSALGVADPAGATFDGSGSLLVLDAADRSIVRSRNGPSEKIERIPLQNTGNAGVRGLAFNPADGLLYVLSDSGKQLFAVDAQGRLRRTYTTRSLGLSDAVGMTFGRSADTTDASGHLNLFVAQAGTSTDLGGVMEVTLTQQAALDVPIVTANLVQTIDTSLFDPPSPDPAGIVYAEAQDRLMIVDSEVDEVTGAGYHGVNLWQTSRSGSVIEKGTTVGFTREPTGLGFDPASETLFVSADDDGGIHVVRQGNDGRFGTSDDLVGFINAAAHGVGDVEDPEFDPASGDLFFIDGVGAEVFRVDPVNNTFGDADDVVTHFDVGQYGVTDAEGLSSDPSAGTLLVGDRIQRKIFEVTKTGELLRFIDARAPGMANLSGLAMAPASNGSGGMNYWIVDRAEDNGAFPAENDGKLFELSVQASGNQPPSVSVVTIDQASPRTDEILTVSVSAQDPDGDAFSYSYQWNRNGVALPGATGPTLDLSVPGTGDRGDRIS
ncbi:MAG: hypothetical protein M3516_08320, partial [Actinomycetota bacterium]|nr:hypothetical protein [Actinomycetota bacterium]